MCGIAGFVRLPDATTTLGPETLDRMLDTLAHRGPNGSGRHVDGPVALGARRLAVIDPEGGDQPLRNEDRQVTAVFNGEIYNHGRLRRDLEATGHHFVPAHGGHSDGAVLPHLVEDLGADFTGRLDGMFAVAVHDARRRRVVLARDPMGIKPLYWTRSRGHLIFASDVPAILATGVVDRRLDIVALAQLLAWEHVPTPRTLFAGIEKLPAGHRLHLDLDTGSITVEAFWRLPSAEPQAGDPRSDAAWHEAIDDALSRAVQRQLGSDVPLGVLLSGGVDSSLIAAAASSDRAIRAFTLATADPSASQGYDESHHARRVAEHLGIRHTVGGIDDDVDAICDAIFPHLADPVIDTSCFPTWQLSQLARRDVTVALAGDGGDELFAGYDTILAQQLAARWRRLPGVVRGPIGAIARRLPPRPAKKGWVNKARRFAEGLQYDERLGHARWRCFADARRLRQLLAPDLFGRLDAIDEALAEPILRHDEPERGPIGRHLAIDLRGQMIDALLAKVDRMSMASSLEVRVPMLDLDLVELAQRVPDRLRVHRGRSKVMLRDLAATKVPRSAIDRPKEGFSAPLKHWLRGPLRQRMETLLDPDRIEQGGILQAPTLRRLIREHLDGRADHAHTLWAAMVVEDWRERWRVHR